MKLFIDTANINDIKQAYEMGIISGATTNPSIIAKEGKKFEDAIAEITNIMPEGLIFAEVVSLEWEGMVKEGKEISAINERMVVKIPMCAEGLKACSVLSKMGIRVCVTLMFSEAQAILAINAGASFVAPFVGRLDDIGWDGLDLVDGIREIIDASEKKAQIVAASARHPIHLTQLAKIGCDITTVPFKVLMQMIDHPLTASGLEKFMKDWESMPK